MQMKHFLRAVPLILAAAALPSQSRADTVLYDAANFVTGQQSFVQSFTVTSAGSLTVSLQDVAWLDTVQDLTFFLTSASGSVGGTMGAGTSTFDLAPGTYYAHWAGNAVGTYNMGVEQLKMQFTTAAPVPLPTSLVMMLSGLGLLIGWQRRPLGTLAPIPVMTRV